MFKYFRDKGYEKFLSGQSKLSIQLPKLEEQEVLGCPALVPILVLEADTYDQLGQILQFSIIRYRSDIFDYTI